jgi:hypothetical protein
MICPIPAQELLRAMAKGMVRREGMLQVTQLVQGRGAEAAVACGEPAEAVEEEGEGSVKAAGVEVVGAVGELCEGC